MALSIVLEEKTSSSLSVSASGYSSAVKHIEWSCSDGSTDTGFTALFTGLNPETTYTITAAFYSSSTSTTPLDTVSTSFTTAEAESVAKTYYARLLLHGNGGKAGGYTLLGFPSGGCAWNAGWEGYADIEISYGGSQFERAGYSLFGFSETDSPAESDPVYPVSGTYTIRARSTDEDDPTIITLYAIWTNARPKDWEWVPAIVSGNDIAITAAHWNAFIEKIKEFAVYKNVPLPSSTISDAGASSGTRMMASQAQAVVSLLNRLPFTISPPGAPSAGDTITAAFMNGLMRSLNSIN